MRTSGNRGWWQVWGLQGPSLCTHTRFDVGIGDFHYVALVMVGIGFPCGHSDCDGNGPAGTEPPHYISCLSTVFPLFQLRRIRAYEGSSFSRFVLGRVVQLTIETNALTGIYPSLGKLLNLTSYS